MAKYSDQGRVTATALNVATIQRTDLVDLREASRVTGIHRDMIMDLARSCFVTASWRWADREEPLFDEIALGRLRQIAELHYNRRVSFRIVRKIFELLDRLDEVEQELEFLRSKGPQ